MRIFTLIWFCFIAFFSKAQSQNKSITLGLNQTVYTDSLPPSPTCTYLVADDITLQGNFDLRGITFLLKSDFRRDKMLNHRVFGTNIRLCGARVNIENCTFLSADSGMWGGIYLADSSSQIRFSQSKLQDSYHGIVQADNSQIVAKNSEFRDNYVSLQLAGKRDTLRHCVFTSKPSRMKMPFDSVAANDYYCCFAHIKNAENKELYLKDKNLILNLFHNAVYGIFANKKHEIQAQENYFIENKLAAIFHQNGGLQLTDTNEIYLPTTLKNTIQMQTERRKQGFPDSITYGIYAQNAQDELNAGNILSAEKPAQTIGYYGFDSDFKATGSEFANFRTAIMLSGEQVKSYTFKGTRFINNYTAIDINRGSSEVTNIPLTLQCNDFISTDAAPRIGLALSGNGIVNSTHVIGGCDNANGLAGRPAGNELRNGQATTNNHNTTPTLPTNFTFINNFLYSGLTQPLFYYKFRNENTDGVFSYATDVKDCDDPIDADISSCYRTSTGVLNRKGQGDNLQAYLGVNVPNPADGRGTSIAYTLPEGTSQAQLLVYNQWGMKVHTETLAEGAGTVQLNTQNWTSGLYSYSLLVNGRLVKTYKMSVVK